MELKKPTVEVVPIDRLHEWEHNPRKKHAVNAIANSIEEFGYQSPIIVQKGTYRILGGHGRLKALRQKKVKMVPVIVADLTDAQAAAFTIADNKLTDSSEFDPGELGALFKDMDKQLAALTGFSDAEINDLAKLSAELPESSDGDWVSTNTTLFVNLPSRDKLLALKAEITKAQVGNKKSIGQVVYEKFFPSL